MFVTTVSSAMSAAWARVPFEPGAAYVPFVVETAEEVLSSGDAVTPPSLTAQNTCRPRAPELSVKVIDPPDGSRVVSCEYACAATQDVPDDRAPPSANV